MFKYIRDPATVNSRIFVGNLEESVTPDMLEEHFKKHGTIRGVCLQRGFGFVQYEDESSANAAIQNEHGVTLQGRKLNVKQAIDKKKAPPGPNNNDDAQPGGPAGEKGKNNGPPARKMQRIAGRGRGAPMDNAPSKPGEDYRDGNQFYGRDGGNYVPPLAPVPDRTLTVPERNDCEIIVVAKGFTEYAEYIEHRLKSIGLIVDLLFPNEDVPIGRVLANISSRGCLYAILVMPQNEEHRSLTLNILHGIPQEHRNMPVDDAVALIARNFEAYRRGEKNGPSVHIGNAPIANDRHPEAIQILLNLLADNRQLTTLQFDRIIKYLQERREMQYKQEVGDTPDTEPDHTKQAELQNRIMSILNKNPTPPIVPVPVITPSASKAPILTDPSVQKALDSLLSGDILKSISSSGRF